MLANITDRRQTFAVASDPGAEERGTSVSIAMGTASALLNRANELVSIDADQAWFWSEAWQAGESATQADFDAGRVHRFGNVDDAIAALGLEEDAGD